MKKALLFLAKLSVMILLIILVEGLFTMGSAFDFGHYDVIGWIVQSCLLILALFAASKEWGE